MVTVEDLAARLLRSDLENGRPRLNPTDYDRLAVAAISAITEALPLLPPQRQAELDRANQQVVAKCEAYRDRRDELREVREEVAHVSRILRAIPDNVEPASPRGVECGKQWKRFLDLLARERELMGGDTGTTYERPQCTCYVHRAPGLASVIQTRQWCQVHCPNPTVEGGKREP